MLSSFCTYLQVTHNSKNISRVHGSSYVYGVGKNVLAKTFFTFSPINVVLCYQYQVIKSISLRKSALYYLIYLCIFLLYYNLYIYVYSALVYHCCVSDTLQRIKTVNKIWWYKQLFFKLCFRVKYNSKPKMCIVAIWLSSYSLFFFFFIFQCFSSVCFLLFFNIFCTPPHNQENHDSK